MSVRVGKIIRHEDVHGVSGNGDHMADVFECNDGTCVVRWLGKDGSTNVYAGVKNAQNVHGHGGKTEIEWIWEQEEDQDPMEKVFAKKLSEAGVVTESVLDDAANWVANEAERAASESDEEAAVDMIAERLAAKVSKKVVEKVAERVAAEEDKPPEECMDEKKES